MRFSLFFGLLFAAVLCFQQSNAANQISQCFLKGPVDGLFGDEVFQVGGYDLMYRGKGEYSATLWLPGVIASLVHQNHYLVEVLANLAILTENTPFRTYTIHVHPNGTYTHTIGLAAPGATGRWDDNKPLHILRGVDAHTFLSAILYKNNAFNPLFFAFDFLHRIVSPAGLLSNTFDQIFDFSNPDYKKRDSGDPLRYYFYNTTDSPKRYTHTQLAKLYTAAPDMNHHMDLPYVYRMDLHTHTPVAHIRAVTWHKHHSNMIHSYLAPMSVQFFSTHTPHTIDNPPPGLDPKRKYDISDLILQMDCTETRWDPVEKSWK
eukprot:GDKI01038495.1.p1 GENE.GDKI01038495.1~~GDKI01038495.1.p1  ORF type:complete len:318 (-),score=47.80 GDKI01038495.1:174-1127(-)